ncbi:hypothetical protein AB0N99_30515 [Streptomyces sp. NPDC093272]|uniref:hypothetical protein n=1 Tax=Streptomyces sp. NPDC093272 TaxID=3154981 RepID=UPI0034355901
MSEEFAALTESKSLRIYIRSWKPGDGLACTYSKAAKSTPCGPPIAVTLTEEERPCWRSAGCFGPTCGCRKAIRRTVCANHIPGLYRSGDVNAEARKAAAERLAVLHWEDYQRFLSEETSTLRAKAFEFADPEIRRIVLGEESAS